MASNHAMFASESTLLCARDEEPADLAVADGANVAVIADCAVCLADVARLPATVSAVGEALSRYSHGENGCRPDGLVA